MTQPASDTGGGARILIGAKLEPPELPTGQVVRPHLLERLDQGMTGRLTLISTPAGYGKTTLVDQWIAGEFSPSAAWLSLDRLDNDLERFVRYVIAALRRVEEGCLPQTEGMLSAQNLPSPQDLAELMVHEIEQLGQQVVLVLDDYGFIRAEVIHELLSSLIPNLPSTLRLVMTSRIDPPLPLSLWRSRHWLHELRAADLRFSREEAGAFFGAANEVELSDEGIETIHWKTEGWVTGLRLALLSLTGAADAEEQVRAFSASDRLVADYLMEEVLVRQPVEIREFLAVTSVLERFSPRLCDELLTGSGSGSVGRSRELIDHIFKKNLFLTPLGSAHDWYRYHHLFRELLTERFESLGSNAPREKLLKDAGDWFSREGWIEDSLKCHVAAGELDAAEDVFGSHLHDVIARDMSRRTLARWLELFPPDAVRTRIPLLVASLHLKTLRADLDSIDDLLRRVDAVCSDPSSDRRCRWRSAFGIDLDFVRAYASFWRGDVERSFEHSSRVLDQEPAPPEYLAAATSMYHGASLALTGRNAEYLQHIERGTGGPGASGGLEELPFLVAKGCVHLYRGELAQVQTLALKLTTSTAFPIPKYYETIGYHLLGVLTYERNQLDDAERNFLAVLSRRSEAPAFFEHSSALGLSQTAMARGDLVRAERHAESARSLAHKRESAMLLASSNAVDRFIAVVAGKAVDLSVPPPPDPDFVSLTILPPSHSWAWVQLRSPSAETWQAALDFVEDALQLAATHGVVRRVIQLSALRSLALDALDRRDEAISCLEEALRRGADLGFVRSFVDCGEGLRPLLEAIAERSPDDEYVAMLLDALAALVGTTKARVRGTAVRGNGTLIEDLTNRELDVLELLERRMTNKEIAAHLGISAATVKMHTLGVYRKLGVHGRRQAVTAATELGILGG